MVGMEFGLILLFDILGCGVSGEGLDEKRML